ncbi:asparagine synthetase [Rivularia sp. IAM M-261]|nr:asparagine synthetase [Rivularia sp. IAM M-261]
MCGIAVIFGEETIQRESSFIKMMDAIASRGEVTETYSNEMVLAGTQRLKIVDREGAIQPLFNQAGDKFIVFNGEIFNFKEIKSKLEGKYNFKTESDTEIILYAFEEYGEECLQLFEGQFAFVIVSISDNRIFCARDRFGIVPLYYVEDDSLIYIASELKALTFLNQKIQVLLPGYWKCGMAEPKRYFTPQYVSHNWELENFLLQLYNTTVNAIKKRVNTDLPIGIIYSGGLDSSIVLSQAIKFHPNITAFTIGANNSEDFQISQRFCQEKGIKQVVIPLGKNDIKLADIKTAITISELTEYGDIINAVITTELYRKIHATGIKVVLGGDCSDELFGGYDMYALNISLLELQQLFLYKLMNLHRTELQRVDRCSMAFKVETRVPFLDNELVQLALSTPRDWKVKGGIEKWCLREAFKQELPDSILKRKKNPLSHSSGLHEQVRLYKLFFEQYYNAQKYYLHNTIQKDFSFVLQEQGYKVNQAIAATTTPTNYSRSYLLSEFLKASARKFMLWNAPIG